MNLPGRISYFIEQGNNYTKEELYKEYVDVVTRLLEEMISIRSYEEIIDYLSPDKGNEIIEDEAEFYTEIIDYNFSDTDSSPQDYIHHLIDVLEDLSA